MKYENLTAGLNPPYDIFALIEISMNAHPIKYEFNKDVHALFVDRFIHTGMCYPCNYGFIPKTLGGDGDPLDVLVYTNYPVIAGALIAVRPLGVLLTEDESGRDEKILTVPITKVDPFFEGVVSYTDLPQHFIHQINYFFSNYKAMESGKWVKIRGWEGVGFAQKVINDGIKNYQS